MLQVLIEPALRPSPNLYEDWMLLVFLLALLNVAYVRMAYQRRLHRLFSSLLRLQILRQVMREELVFSHRASVLLFLNFVLLAALIVYLAFKYFSLELPFGPGPRSYLVFVVTLAAVYYGKLLLNRGLRWLLRDSGLIREYLFEVFLINKAAGLLALPLGLAIAILNIGSVGSLFWAALLIVAILLLFRVIKGLLMSQAYPVSRVYIILYLCSLEIVPFLVLIKALQRELT
jgi:hypothetical protein